jgi:hypothetical protein
MQEFFQEAVQENKKLIFPVEKSNKSRVIGKLRYWWCWTAAAAMLLFVAAPALVFLWLISSLTCLFPIALSGGESWLTACGAEVKVTGL